MTINTYVVCGNCNQVRSEHANDKCLFGATAFRAMTEEEFYQWEVRLRVTQIEEMVRVKDLEISRDMFKAMRKARPL